MKNEIWKPIPEQSLERPDNMAEFFDGFAVLDPISVPERSGIKGVLLGEGETVVSADPKSGMERRSRTWRIQTVVSEIRIYGSAILNDRLSRIVEMYGEGGAEVALWRGDTIARPGGRRLQQWTVGVRPIEIEDEAVIDGDVTDE